MRVEWEDLLERGFAFGGRGEGDLDCAGVAEAVLERLGRLDVGASALPDYTSICEAGDALAWYFQRFTGMWEKLGDEASAATRVGDILMSDPTCEGKATHISILVDDKKGTFLTSIKGHGVVTDRRWSIPGIVGAYRMLKEPTP